MSFRRAHRKSEEVLALAEPHQPAVGRPVRHALMRDDAAIGDRAMEDRVRGRKHEGPQLGMDAVGANDDIGLRGAAIGERHAGLVAVLFEAGAAVAGMHDARRQGLGQEFDEVGAMHAECRVPARGVRSPAPGRSERRHAGNNENQDRPARPISPPRVPIRPAASGARCSASEIPLRRLRRAPAPVRRPPPAVRAPRGRWRQTGRLFRLQR